ncbi:MAG: Tm-1-like ATP-binding domain-containing protein, partial [Planctomycetaceae bacterium]
MLLCLFATLDTKGVEAGYVRDRLLALDVPVRLVDAGSAGTPTLAADVTREELFAAAGTTLAEVQAQGDRGTAVGWAARGAAALARLWLDRGELAGVLGLGGSAGTTIGTAAMRALPLGVPKLMVSTLAS